MSQIKAAVVHGWRCFDVSGLSKEERQKRFATTPEVAAELGIKRQSVYYHFRKGNFTRYRCGRWWLVDRFELGEYIKRRGIHINFLEGECHDNTED